MATAPGAAAALYPHLQTGTPERRPERNQSIGQAMWPTLGPQPKPSTASESLRRHLQEAVANIDKRQRGGR